MNIKDRVAKLEARAPSGSFDSPTVIVVSFLKPLPGVCGGEPVEAVRASINVGGVHTDLEREPGESAEAFEDRATAYAEANRGTHIAMICMFSERAEA